MTTNVYADAIADAYDRLAGLGYERGAREFANHGPMGAEALCALGFGDEAASWVEDYKRGMRHHDPPEPGFRIDPSDEQSWRPALGRFDRVGDWEQLFVREFADRPWRDVLAEWWSRLLPGLMAALTHGLIRTAHAVRCLSTADAPDKLATAELARGLAYWAGRYWTPEVDEPVAADELTPVQVGRRLSELTSTFAGVYLDHPEVMPVPLIHGVTAPAAMRLALAQLPDELHAMSLQAMHRAHAAMLTMFVHDTEPGRNAPDMSPMSWQELLGRAVMHGDEHVVKFTEACSRENALRPDPRYPAAVRAALERIPARALGGGASTV